MKQRMKQSILELKQEIGGVVPNAGGRTGKDVTLEQLKEAAMIRDGAYHIGAEDITAAIVARGCSPLIPNSSKKMD